MNAALEKLLPQLESWLDEDQEALAEAAREIAALRTGFYPLSAEEEAAVEAGQAAAARGEFASDDRVQALWRRAGL